MFEIKVTDQFSASHRLRGYDGQCENLHGHNWKVDVVAGSQKLDSMGVVVDFEDVKKELRNILEEFDHQNMNDLPVFKDKNPTAEHTAQYIFSKLSSAFGQSAFKISSVTVWETKDARATYTEN